MSGCQLQCRKSISAENFTIVWMGLYFVFFYYGVLISRLLCTEQIILRSVIFTNSKENWGCQYTWGICALRIVLDRCHWMNHFDPITNNHRSIKSLFHKRFNQLIVQLSAASVAIEHRYIHFVDRLFLISFTYSIINLLCKLQIKFDGFVKTAVIAVPVTGDIWNRFPMTGRLIGMSMF